MSGSNHEGPPDTFLGMNNDKIIGTNDWDNYVHIQINYMNQVLK